MTAPSFDRRFWAILASLVIILVGVVLTGSLVGLPAPQLVPQDRVIGARGPLALVFAESMQTDSVEQALAFDPPLAGHFTWGSLDGRADRVVSFWPDQPLRPGQTVSVRLDAGVLSQTGLSLRKAQDWQVSVRPPVVLYLSPVDAPEVWLVSLKGGPPRQVTSTGGAVFDFSVAPDGEKVLYSAYNDQLGVDIWEIGQDGEKPHLLLPCQSDWCVNPVYAPDGQTIAYSRRRSGTAEGEGPGVPYVWLLDRSGGSTDILYSNPDISGHDLVWSPDGRFLAFFDGLSGGVRVLDVLSGTDTLLPSQSGMTGDWSPDSRSLIFTDYHSSEHDLYVAVYRFDLATGETSRILADDRDQLDYSGPVWSLDGKQLVVAQRPMNGSPTRQLWLYTLDPAGGFATLDRLAITGDQQYTYASYHWDPTGENLVYQRLALARPDQKPQVGVWNRIRQEFMVLAEDAFQPRWAP